ncbi:helix-turn-helix domain-containing protein [Enterococcus sp. 5H]|uniref:helix-turn-helix domain-containing protein n=1 Tax=Enterococcus sp. 5H TaxID=1229490 RepID=UPI00230478DE|nr:helix-turn-helix transcriptional regulator [Enterococcus sp. 5H]
MSPYRKIRRENGMTREELALCMQLPLEKVELFERENITPTLHYHANFKAIFNVTEDDIKRATKTN